MRDFLCWFPDADEEDADGRPVSHFDAEDAAREIVETVIDNPFDYDGHLVAVKDVDTGELTHWRVFAEMSIDYRAEQVREFPKEVGRG